MLKRKGDNFKLIGTSGCVLGTVCNAIFHNNLIIRYLQAVRTSDDATNPVYVSVGHKISLETATRLTVACSRKRVPEPIRMVSTARSTIILNSFFV